MEYKEGTCMADFNGEGLTKKSLEVTRQLLIQLTAMTGICFCIQQNQTTITMDFIIRNILLQLK
jgi:hypothetical protein